MTYQADELTAITSHNARLEYAAVAKYTKMFFKDYFNL